MTGSGKLDLLAVCYWRYLKVAFLFTSLVHAYIYIYIFTGSRLIYIYDMI